MRSWKTRGAIGSLGLVLAASLARAAEPPPPRAERIFSPGRSTAGEDSAESLVLNPANLGYQPAGELRWTGVRCPDTTKVGCGHSFGLATPLIWGIGTGLRLDYVTPPWTAGAPFNGYDYTWVTWGVGMRLSDSLSVGFSLQRSYSQNGYTNALFGVSSAITYRPNSHFAIAGVAHDWNGPSSAPVTPGGAPVLDPSYVLALDFRPTGTRAIDIGLEAKWLEGSDQVLPRALLGLEIPGVGRARADIEVAHMPNDDRRAVIGTAGLEVSVGQASLGGGVIAGNGLGSNSAIGEYVTASVRGYVTPGVPHVGRAVAIKLESTPGTRGHIALLRHLWKLSEQPDIRAVTLVLKAEPVGSFAHAEELSDAIRVLRARGKKVMCALEHGGTRSLFVCANADRTILSPAGTFRFAGLKSQFFYLAGLMDKIGVKGEFVRISPHKSAPEQFTNTEASDVARADHEDLLRENEAVFTKDVSQGRHLSAEQVRQVAERGISLPAEAKEARFVDDLVFDDEVERATQALVGSNVAYEKYDPPVEAPERFGPQSKVAILYIDGDIVDGRSQRVPLLDMKLVGSYTIAETIKEIKDDPSIKSVVLRIESPGGSTSASDAMWRELTLLAKKKPLIVSMGAVAASGGYYVAAPGRMIFAEPLTVTGSIGVFYGKADVSGLLRKIGVNIETYKTAPHADAESLFRGFTGDERARAQSLIESLYDTFLSRVSESRHMSKESIDAVAKGRVWSGQEAYERHIVDKLGGIREALEAAREAGGLAADAPIVQLPEVKRTLLDWALETAGIDARAQALSLDGLPVEIRDVARAVGPLAVHANRGPLARLEWVSVDDQDGEDGPEEK